MRHDVPVVTLLTRGRAKEATPATLPACIQPLGIEGRGGTQPARVPPICAGVWRLFPANEPYPCCLSGQREMPAARARIVANALAEAVPTLGYCVTVHYFTQNAMPGFELHVDGSIRIHVLSIVLGLNVSIATLSSLHTRATTCDCRHCAPQGRRLSKRKRFPSASHWGPLICTRTTLGLSATSFSVLFCAIRRRLLLILK